MTRISYSSEYSRQNLIAMREPPMIMTLCMSRFRLLQSWRTLATWSGAVMK